MQAQARKILEQLNANANYRTLRKQLHLGQNIALENGKWLLNLSNNDYLGISQDGILREKFLDSKLFREHRILSSTSSRLLSGNYEIYTLLENYLQKTFNKEALLFNSGYHANLGAIGALRELSGILFVADKSIHASHIDGLKGFKKAHIKRFSHNDINALENILQNYAEQFSAVVILSEGLFSMEGDFAPLKELVRLKKAYKNVFLYIDEAHCIGSFGELGLGVCESLGLLDDIDFLVLTFGKAIASMGACVLCNGVFKEFFINTARSLIYSTALPPLNVACTLFNFLELPNLSKKRAHLASISKSFKESIKSLGYEVLGDYNIISLVLGENQKAIDFSNKLAQFGYFAPAIKTPSVPKNRALLRFSLNASITKEQLESLIFTLKEISCNFIKN